MLTVTNVQLGFAMYLASEFAATLQNRFNESDHKSREKMLKRSDLEAMEHLCPFMPHDMEEANPEVTNLMNFIHDQAEEEGQISLFDPKEFLGYVEVLFGMVRNGKLKSIAAMQEDLWRELEDSDVEQGCLIDVGWMLNFHEAMNKAKRPIVWQSGSFLAVVDCDDMADEWWSQS